MYTAYSKIKRLPSERAAFTVARGRLARPPLADMNPAYILRFSFNQDLPAPDFRNFSLCMASFLVQ